MSRHFQEKLVYGGLRLWSGNGFSVPPAVEGRKRHAESFRELGLGQSQRFLYDFKFLTNGHENWLAIEYTYNSKLYKVMKIGRNSCRKKLLEINLTEPQAQRLVKSYPESNRSMVVYYLQGGGR